MPTTKASKAKRVKGKGKKDSKHVPKVDKESDVETARVNAALWELRLKVSEQDVAEYRQESHKLALANEHITNQLYCVEKSSIDMTGYWQKEVAAKEEKITMLREGLKKQEALSLEEKNKLVSSKTCNLRCNLVHITEPKEFTIMNPEVVSLPQAALEPLLQRLQYRSTRDFNLIQDRMREMEEREAQMEQELSDMRESMDIADKEHKEKLNKMGEKFFKEKACLEREVMERCKIEIAMLNQDHRGVVAPFRQLESALHAAFMEHDRLNESLKNTMEATEEFKKLTHSLTEENISLALDKEMLESMVKKNVAQMEVKKKKLSELMAKVASLEKTLNLKEEKLEQQEKQQKMNLVTIEASQVELDKLREVLAMREKEMHHVKQVASTIVKKRTELEEFFHEVLNHVREQIVASRIRYKQEALQDYRRRFREATAGKIKFPPIRTFHKNIYSTNSVYSDMEAASEWSHPSGTEVQLSDLTWEQKEQVLSLLFAKMNGQKERKVCQHLDLRASSEKQKSLNDTDVAE
ncbi:basal body-orientation factor 1-like [Leuresthes tenuis]|uniref:basal body-orientation factor 1-like n=1 Tax=Leuresthes tenuis TaxID=355514 RepID=UPI003B5138EA